MAHTASKTVELRIPGYDRVAAITGSERDDSVIGAIEGARGSYEPHVMALISDILEADSISIDIGANIGVITVAMAWASPRGRVHAFEAAPSNFEYLVRNVRQNGLDQVAAENLAILDEHTEIELSYVEDVAGCSFYSPVGVREGRSERVSAVPLDEWVATGSLRGGGPIRLIKLDVEGAEIRALRGAFRTLREHRPRLLIEFNPVPIERFFHGDPRDLVELLLEIFPAVDLIDDADGSLSPVTSFDALNEIVRAGKGWEDLYCRF